MNQLIQPMQQLAQFTGEVLAYQEEIVHAFAWQAAPTRTGSTKAVGTGEHAGQTLYGAKAQKALAGKTEKAKPAPAKKEQGAKKPTGARMELNVRKASDVATQYLRQANEAKKTGDAKKAQGLVAAAYGMNSAAKHIEDGNLERARAAIAIAGEFASGKRQLKTAPSVNPTATRSAAMFRPGAAPASKPIPAAKTAPKASAPPPDVSAVLGRMKALNANRTITITGLRAGMDELEKLPKEHVAEVARQLGYPSISTLSKPAMIQKLRANLEGIKMSQYRADQIMGVNQPARKS